MLVGRMWERSEIESALERARSGESRALALVGEPGIGKTALLDYASEHAAGMQLLSARGVESEARIPFASLLELLRPALPLTEADSPAYLPGLFQTAIGSVLDSPKITEKVRGGGGFGWHEHVHDVHEGCERFFRPGYNAHLIAEWLPSLDGVVEKLERGALVADVGCGHGASTILMAKAFPNSTFMGSDYHDGSIETARQRAQEAGVADRVSFQIAPAASYGGSQYDLVTMFDCLHDMGDPVGAARHVSSTLKPDGTWMIVEPNAGDRVEDNLNPVGRAFYGFSTLLCTPASLSQDVGLALGAQAGQARIQDVVHAGGFTQFRRASETPFNLVYEARP